MMVADVIYPKGGRTGLRPGIISIPLGIWPCGAVENPHDAFHDIVDIRKVTPHIAEVKHLYRFVPQDGIGEDEQRHVGPSPWSVNGKESKTGARNAIEMGIAMRHEFVGLFRGGVERNGMIDIVADRERHLV